MWIARAALLVLVLPLFCFACTEEAGLGEQCEGNTLVTVTCARGLVCDDHADFTCQYPGRYADGPDNDVTPDASADDASASD